MTRSKEQALTAEAVLASLVSNLPGYLYWKDVEGVYKGCNDYHAQRLGFKQGTDLLGKTDSDLLGKEINPRFSHYDTAVLSQGQTRIIEEMLSIRGQEVILLSLKSPILGKRRQVLGVLNISLDITRERRLEERVRAYKKEHNELTIAVLPRASIKRILILKTESIVAAELQQVFEQAGCLVDVVEDIDSALTQVRIEYYTLIFMDTSLCDVDGVKLAQKIRQHAEKNRDTPIIGFDACR